MDLVQSLRAAPSSAWEWFFDNIATPMATGDTIEEQEKTFELLTVSMSDPEDVAAYRSLMAQVRRGDYATLLELPWTPIGERERWDNKPTLYGINCNIGLVGRTATMNPRGVILGADSPNIVQQGELVDMIKRYAGREIGTFDLDPKMGAVFVPQDLYRRDYFAEGENVFMLVRRMPSASYELKGVPGGFTCHDNSFQAVAIERDPLMLRYEKPA